MFSWEHGVLANGATGQWTTESAWNDNMPQYGWSRGWENRPWAKRDRSRSPRAADFVSESASNFGRLEREAAAVGESTPDNAVDAWNPWNPGFGTVKNEQPHSAFEAPGGVTAMEPESHSWESPSAPEVKWRL